MADRRLKIGILFGKIQFGGVARLYTELAPFLGSVFDVDFIVLDGSGTDYTGFERFVGEIRPIGPGGEFSRRNPAKVFNAIKGYLRIVRSKRYDLIMSSGDLLNQLCVMFARPMKYKTILSVHADFSFQGKRIWPPREFALRKFLTSRCFSRAGAVVCVSKGISQDLTANLKVPPEKCRVIHNPVDGERIAALAREQTGSEESRWFSGDCFHFISAGRLTEAKNFPMLIRAFSETLRHVPARLTILGDGEERSFLERTIKELNLEDRVWMPGFRKNIFKYLARADCFVSSSDWEGFGNVIVEAMICGLPILATHCSGPADILYDGKSNSYGKTVPIGDCASLVREMVGMARIPGRREKYSQLSLKRTEKFHCEFISEKYKDLIEEIAKDG